MTEKRKYSKQTDEEIAAVIMESRSLTEAAELLDINRKTVQRVAWTHDVEPTNERRPNHDRVLNKIRTRRTPHIMRYVKRWGLLPYSCLWCGLEDSWNGKTISLQLDHIDGDPLNNKLENLRWLCPNCHSQTETFCGKNVKRGGDANDYKQVLYIGHPFWSQLTTLFDTATVRSRISLIWIGKS